MSSNSRVTDAMDLRFEKRALSYLEAVLASGSSNDDPDDGIFQLVPAEVFRLIPYFELDRSPVDTSPLQAALVRINGRKDCADFVLAGLQRILLRYRNSSLLTADLRKPMEDAVLNFCYWYDQPRIRGMCFHTENHQILFHVCEVLAGQQFPDRVFPNSGKNGTWHSEQGKARALRWMDERARFGFAEWLSCYFEEDLLALLNLHDFAEDPTLRRRAGMLIDMVLFEIALNTHNGILGTTHGRTYAEYIKGGKQDPVSAISWLVFGEGMATNRPNLALVSLSTSEYRCPRLIAEIAVSPPTERASRQSCGLNVADAARWGLHPDRMEDQMFFWACQTARHPMVRATSKELAEIAEEPWLSNFIDEPERMLETTRSLVEVGGAVFDGDSADTALSSVDIVSFRTPEYVLSCAQDFRPGRPGYQQHVWQATLDRDAVVFTNHPGTSNESSAHSERPNFWAGNRFLPRAAQHRNVLVCVHHLPENDPLPFSHAYFPRAKFDQIEESGNWMFGRKGEGFIALYSQHSASWAREGTHSGIELRADFANNIWICEMGTVRQWGGFEQFVDKIAASRVAVEGLSVTYASPSLGTVNFGWTGPLTVAFEKIPLHGYPRYDNPYCHAEIGDRKLVVKREDEILTWDFERDW